MARRGKYIRAPEIFFKIIEKGKEKGIFIPLGKIARVRAGIKTGADEFFYLTSDKVTQWKIEKEYLRPVIKSPRLLRKLAIDRDDIKHFVLFVNKDKKDLIGTNVLKYIEYGEKLGLPHRATIRRRKPWYNVGQRDPAPLLIPGIYYSRLAVYYNRAKALTDYDLYEIIPYNAEDVLTLGALLNSTIYAVIIPIWGRGHAGGRSIEIRIYELANMPVINLSLIHI